MRHRWVIAFGAAFTCFVVAHGEPGQNPTARQATPAPRSDSYLTGTFDPSASRLPAHFKGHDPVAITRAIETLPILKEKSEFESTAEFEARYAKFPQQTLLGRLRGDSVLAFVVPAGADSADQSSFNFDADAQSMKAELDGTFALGLHFPRLELRGFRHDEGSYISTNAFGAKVRVSKFHDEDYSVTFFTDYYKDQVFHRSDRVSFLLPMASEEARRRETGLRFLLVCRLIDPWAESEVESHDPTIDDPNEFTVKTHSLDAVLQSLWIFDERTGEVLKKVDGGGEITMPAK
jgi:hypothetical protein